MKTECGFAADGVVRGLQEGLNRSARERRKPCYTPRITKHTQRIRSVRFPMGDKDSSGRFRC